MPRPPRRNHSPDEKAKAALAAPEGDVTLAKLAARFELPPRSCPWREQLLAGAVQIFAGGGQAR